jgi:YD repeat-containing protein
MALSYTHAPQNMIDRPSVIKVYGSGVLLSETDYTYDESTPTAVASPIGHDEANYGPGSSYARGNLTTLRRKCFQGGTSCSDAVFHITYDTTGQPVSVQDANQNVTQISYADNYTSDDGTPSGNTNTYVTQLTRPSTNSVSHIQRFQWDFNKGELRVATDESGQKTMYFYNDPWSRLTETDFADQGKVTVSYSDAGPNPTVTTTQLVSLSPLVSKTSIAVMDGVGHVTQSQVTTDPQGTVYADTTYDGMGRAYTVSNPYRSKGESTYGVMTNTYDAFGRTTSLAMQDGVSTVGTSYVGNCSTVTDEDGRQRTSCSDALGRLTSVTEDPNGSNFQTLYKYDALNNLLCVEQDGNATSGTHCSAYPGAFSATNPYRVRQFFYNSLSRLMQSQNPEAGTINYYYDPNGNLISKADARGITISYSPIDALNRVTEKTYSDSTPSVTYVYDTATNGVGRLASDVTADSQGNAISSSYGYDVMGRPASATQCFGSNCATTSAVWNPSSTLLSLTYPSSRKLKYVYDGVARLSAVVFDTFDSNDVGYPYYAAVQSEGYWPSGLIKTAQFGNGLYEFTHQNVRLQPDGFTVSKSGVLVACPIFCTSSIVSVAQRLGL